jgi:uncharacterized protein involved in exopolysaccharide biosynthesis
MTHNGSVAHTPGTQTTLRDVWSSIRRSRWLVLGITVTVVALVGVFTALATPTYESEATLRITSKESGSGMLGDLPQFAGLGSAVQNLRDNLLVERQAGRSKLVEISFRHRDPQLAATAVNAVAASFVGYKRETSKTESRSMVEFLREQTETYGRQLAESEARMRGFREQRRVVNPGEEAIQQVRQAATLRAEREATQIERQSLAQLLAQANQGARSATSDSPCRQLATFPSFITNPAVQAILGRLTSLEDERSALLLRFTPENEQVRRIGQRIQELEIQLYRLAVDYLRSLDNKIAAANAALARSGKRVRPHG